MPKECDICYMKYDIEKHQPRIFGKCGHTICLQCLNNIILETKNMNRNMPKWLLRCPWDQSWYLMDENTNHDAFPINRVFYEDLQKIFPFTQSLEKIEFNKSQSKIQLNATHHKNSSFKSKKDIFYDDYGLKLEEEKIKNQFEFKKQSQQQKCLNNIDNSNKTSSATSLLETTIISKDRVSPIICKNITKKRKRVFKDIKNKEEAEVIKSNSDLEKSIKNIDNLKNLILKRSKLKNNSKSKDNKNQFQSLEKNSPSMIKSKKRKNSKNRPTQSINQKKENSNNMLRSESKLKIDRMIKEINIKFKTIFKEKSVELNKIYYLNKNKSNQINLKSRSSPEKLLTKINALANKKLKNIALTSNSSNKRFLQQKLKIINLSKDKNLLYSPSLTTFSTPLTEDSFYYRQSDHAHNFSNHKYSRGLFLNDKNTKEYDYPIKTKILNFRESEKPSNYDLINKTNTCTDFNFYKTNTEINTHKAENVNFAQDLIREKKYSHIDSTSSNQKITKYPFIKTPFNKY